MGDFVGRVTSDAADEWALPLFGDENRSEAPGDFKRSPICDFTLYQMEGMPVVPPEVVALLEVESHTSRVSDSEQRHGAKRTRRKSVKYSAAHGTKARKPRKH
jgi:hypothetical protein